MKKIISTILISIAMFSCGYIETKKESLTRPAFEEQETLYLNRFPIDIIPTFFVWNAKYSEFLDAEDAKEGTLFKAVKNPNIEKNIYTITDVKNKVDYKVMENIDLSNDFLYEITSNTKRIGYIKQIDKDDILNYIFVTNDNSDDKFYRIEGKSRATKTTGINPDIVHSFNFEIKDEERVYCNIFKEYYIFKNEYEIIANKSQNKLENPIFVCISLFIDQILRENGYEYR